MMGGPRISANGSSKRSAYGGYASSIVSQDIGGSSIVDGASVAGGAPPSSVGVSIGIGGAVGNGAGAGASIAYSQADRLRRRRGSLSASSVAGASDLGSSLSAFDYKSQDDAADLDDVKSQYTGTQSGVTVF